MAVEKVNYRKHILRYLILVVALLAMGCEDEGCALSGPNFCGEQVTINENTVLSAQKPNAKYVTGEACGAGELFFQVNYQYADAPFSSSARDRPPITVKFGTLEKGVINNATVTKPQYISGDGKWAQGIGMYHYPATEKDSPSMVHWAVSVTLQKPLISLPGNNPPTIGLPFVTLLGPKTRDVKVNVYIKYLEPKNDSAEK
jgi:hypothetical protein